MHKTRILVVEDEPDILELLSYNLGQANFEVVTAEDGEAALKMVEKSLPDLILLDLMLPGTDGLEVCRLIKQNDMYNHIPIIMLTARAGEIDRIVGFELGADDYVVKPFSPRELILRIKSILRRSSQDARQADSSSEKMFRVGPISIDPSSHLVIVDGKSLHLTSTEFRLLLILGQRRGRVQTREELLSVVWGYQHSGYGRTVDTHVRRLREKLGDAQSWIETIRGVGYRCKKEII